MTSEPTTTGGVGGSSAAVRERLLAERDRLTSLRDGVQSGLADESESSSLSELSVADQHPADVGTETFNRERDLAVVESIDGELSDVEAALDRLEAGRYGICEACGRPIGAERLDALPATRFCVEDAELAAAEAAPGVAPLGPSGGDGLEEPGRAI
ncbi:MAG TPA: TraR/DksA C4-type zinc finger protein [Acidimicrobiales bacterium]|nr:TraR/DksA C4-type zinc finger protein [Acidimicrobiales bacterium]